MYPKKKSSWFKHFDFFLWDCTAFGLAWFLSVYARHGSFVGPDDMRYREMAIMLLLIAIVVSFFTESHSGILRRGYLIEFKSVLKQTIFVCGAGVLMLFFLKVSTELSRLVLLYFGVSYCVFLYLFRVLWKLYLQNHGNLFESERSILLLTDVDMAEETAAHIKEHVVAPFHIMGIHLLDEDTNMKKVGDYPVIGSGEDVFSIIRNAWVDEVFVRLSPGKSISEDTLDRLRRMGITVHLHLSKRQEKNQMVEKMFGCNVLTTCVHVATARQLAVKRVMDIVGSLFGLFFALIAGMIIGPIIYIQSPGPILFSQTRIGKNGKRFKIYKFRSMYLDAEERKKELMSRNKMSGHMFKIDADPRIIGSGPDGTKHGIGWFIRKTSIDELPQFWNVLIGDMSLVGTRPPTVDEWEQYGFYHRARMATKPGITGMWQVSGRSDITDFEEVVSLDMDYIENWTLGSDIKILFKTVWVVFTRKGSV
ncbi:MAG: sugar transferase [Lachnospiraceae bacterium]|nr:sugar transferase [Lachnospiraceae bacterium]